MAKANQITPLKDLYLNYFIEYASYVNLDRAIPHIDDGLKPVQRRILHALKELDDGRLNKVAGIIGQTMNYHPHGDLSIFGALVILGQKNYLVDTEGSWGNRLTGAEAAAPRYIEGRLSPLARETLFNPKLTEWVPNYDGRKQEPVYLPAKFPILLCQGSEGIGVGFSSIILPHNFNEVIDACIASLKGEDFTLYPDNPLGGTFDISNYNDGKGGGKILSRATIVVEKNDLKIVDLPYGKTTEALVKSIEKAHDSGKIKISHVESFTSDKVEILIELPKGSDPEKTKEALYAFTDCEVSIAPNAVVIKDNKPAFLAISDIVHYNANRTKDLLKRELEIKIEELQEKWHMLNLERVFIENKIYLEIEQANSQEEAILKIGIRIQNHLGEFRREVTDEDLNKLTEIKIRRIGKYDKTENQKAIEATDAAIEEARKKIARINSFTIKYFEALKTKYGALYPRTSIISGEPFKKVSVEAVALTNTKIYWNPKEGFIGTGPAMKKEELLPFEVNKMTDIAAIGQNGVLKVNRPADKVFYTDHLLDARIVEKNGDAPIYNMIYLDKETNTTYAKRFQIDGGFTRDKAYFLAGKSDKNQVLYLAIQHPSEKPEVAKIKLKEGQGARKTDISFDFADLAIKNREAQGNTITKYQVKSVQ
jgi:topoisomerase-4 subunit A